MHRLPIFLLASLSSVTAARADVAPDPAVLGGVAAAAIGVLALAGFGVFFLIRYLRRPRR